MHQEHKNEDGTFSYFMHDGNGQEMEVIVEAGPIADALDESNRDMCNQEDYIRQHRDERVEQMRRNSVNANDDYDGDPMVAIPDKKPSVHELACGEPKLERYEITVVRSIVEKLPEKKQNLFFQRYGELTSKAAIGRDEGVTREAIRRREVRLLDEIKRMLAEEGIDVSYFDSRKP